MPIYFFNTFFWELLSILSLTMFSIFWFIERISTEKYPMAKLLSLFIIVAAALVLWVRLELVTPPYQIHGLVDLILLAAMACVGIHFVVLILRACAIKFSRQTERWFFLFALLAIAAYGFCLYVYGVHAQFMRLHMIVNYWIRPFWILVVLTLLARIQIRR